MKRFLIGGCVCLLLLMSGCSSRTSLTADGFESKMAEKDYEIIDVTEQFSDTGLAETVLLAVSPGYEYQIEFFVLATEEDAVSSFQQNQQTMEALETGNHTTKSASAANYNYYILTTKEGYFVVSRIDNTMIYATVPVEYKDEVSEIISELGY